MIYLELIFRFECPSTSTEGAAMSIPIHEPLFDYFRWTANDPFHPRRSDDQTDQAVQRLYQAFLPIASSSKREDEEYREVWITLDRGNPEDWCTFEQYCEEPLNGPSTTPTREAWLEEWEWCFPEETYWHLVSCNRYEEWITICVDGNLIIQTSPEEKARYHDSRVDKLLYGLAEKVEHAVRLMRTDKYAQWLRDALPFERRYGLIQRKKMWGATEGSFDKNWNISAQEAEKLAEMLRAQPSKREIGRLPLLTTGKYFEALRLGYQATGRSNDRAWINDISAEDGRAWYARFGDARDPSLLDIDPQSADAFETWYSTNLHRFDHNFEIFMGRGCSRVHMNPQKDEQGWFCCLWGSITWHASDMARVWEAVTNAGMPTFICDSNALANALTGEDWILIVPKHLSCDYIHGRHFGREIRTAVPLPDEHRDAIVAATDWQEPEIPQLAESL